MRHDREMLEIPSYACVKAQSIASFQGLGWALSLTGVLWLLQNFV